MVSEVIYLCVCVHILVWQQINAIKFSYTQFSFKSVSWFAKYVCNRGKHVATAVHGVKYTNINQLYAPHGSIWLFTYVIAIIILFSIHFDDACYQKEQSERL